MRVFLAYPFSHRELVDRFAKAFVDAESEVLRADIFASHTGDLLAEITSSIRTSDVVVALISEHNPNVLYEVGLASGANVPVLLVASDSDQLPAPLMSVPYIQLTGDSDRDTMEVLRRATELANPPRIARPQLDSAEDTLSAAAKDPAVLDSLSPIDFERLVAEIFEGRGYSVEVDAPNKSGFDFVVESAEHVRVGVEVKKLSNQSRVSAGLIRRLHGAALSSGLAGAILVSSSGFTAAALALASSTPVVLLTLDELLAQAKKSKTEERETGE